MKHDQELLERYAMKAAEMTEPLTPVEMLGIAAIGAAINLDRDQSIQLAGDMQQEGWAMVDYRLNPPKLQLTLAGKKAIAEFHLPKWRRWMHKNPGVLAGVVASGISVSFTAVLELFKWWLRQP